MGLIYIYIYKYGTHSRRKVYHRVVYPLYVYVYKHIQIWDSYIHMYTNFEFTTGKKVYDRVVLPPIYIYIKIHTNMGLIYYIQIWDSYIHIYTSMELTPGEKSMIESSNPSRDFRRFALSSSSARRRARSTLITQNT